MLSVLAVLMIAAVLVYSLWEKPPEIVTEEPVSETPVIPEETTAPTPEPMPEGTAFDSGRQDGVYTILLAGVDLMSGSTDTILVGKLDTVQHTMNFVSIPRDTIINVDWEVRKINSVYIGSKNAGGTGIDALSIHIRRTVGFVPDCYAVLDINTFIQIIDELGGVDYDVPFEMEYDYWDVNPGERVRVYLAPGYQHIDGLHAMAIVRNRYGYITGDLERIEIQQDFMRSCIEQFISAGTIPHAGVIARILAENMDTDLSAANIAWFMRQALLCGTDNIRFSMMPADDCELMGYSYALPKLYEWIDMINEQLNPFEDPIGYYSLNVIYWDGSTYRGTAGLEGEWYFQ